MASWKFAFIDHSQTSLVDGIHHEAVLTVPVDAIRDMTFDTTHVVLSGCVRSTIGSETATEHLITLTDTRSFDDFAGLESSDTSPRSAHRTAVSFDLPSKLYTSNGKGDGQYFVLPSSMLTKGSTYIAKQTALSDRQLVQGSCEVLYWLEARFMQRNTLVQRVTCPITVTFKSKPAFLGHLNKIQGGLQFHAKSMLTPRFWSKSTNNLTITLSQAGPLSKSPTSSFETFPLSLLVSSSDAEHTRTLQEQSLRCTVEARWETMTRFSGREGSITRHQISPTQASWVELPPFYATGTSSGKYRTSYLATTSDLMVGLPEVISPPSVSTELFTRSHTLDLTLRFEENKPGRKYIAHTRLPVTFAHDTVQGHLQQDSRSIKTCGYDAFNVSACLEAPPPYME